jgi:ABC-type transport system substrate-binding protein
VIRRPEVEATGPYLDGIEYTIIANGSTRMLAFVAGKLDLSWVSGFVPSRWRASYHLADT